MKYKLSIIIPIYNVEAYIEECLDSIFTQLPDEVEIIMINDGTPDCSMEIIKSKYRDWLVKDQIVVIEQENAGPGAARNRGLDVAQGEYIGFLDSDDMLLENYFTVLFEVLDVHTADIIEFGFQSFHEVANILEDEYKGLYSFEGLYKLQDVRNEIYSTGAWFPCIRIYKKKIFDKLRFPEGVFYEDLMLISEIYLRDLSIYFLDKPLIGYRFNPNSTTAVHNESHAMDMYHFYTSLMEYSDSVPVDTLKIRTARSIAYFYNELVPLDVPMKDVLKDIKKIKKRLTLLKNLKFPDLIFFLFSRFYMMIDRLRLQQKKGKI